ncbi:hypothetical protein EYF80_049011 [Liparis tanakae]|uniref:Uncharacterized protein n=1 Tax=Liparis tanakae TaxID=230148 RepID=A0A4Z2FIS3_9TELE|nr:hypothetical protein EYF80_049011 [Liparis tanakae]
MYGYRQRQLYRSSDREKPEASFVSRAKETNPPHCVLGISPEEKESLKRLDELSGGFRQPHHGGAHHFSL